MSLDPLVCVCVARSAFPFAWEPLLRATSSVAERGVLLHTSPLLSVCHPPGGHHPSSPVHPGLPHPAPCALVLSRTSTRCSSTELARLLSSERHLQDSKSGVVPPRCLGVAWPRPLPASTVAHRSPKSDFSVSARARSLTQGIGRAVLPRRSARIVRRVPSPSDRDAAFVTSTSALGDIQRPSSPLRASRPPSLPTRQVSPARPSQPPEAFQPPSPARPTTTSRRPLRRWHHLAEVPEVRP
jgi:hypothetical protein